MGSDPVQEACFCRRDYVVLSINPIKRRTGIHLRRPSTLLPAETLQYKVSDSPAIYLRVVSQYFVVNP